MLDQRLLKILVCPETKQPVRLATPEEVEQIRAKARTKSLKTKAGQTASEQLDGILIRQDGQIGYPIRAGIPIMLADEGLLLQ